MPRRPAITALIDPKIMGKLEAAADAINSTPEQLAMMLIDAGFVQTPKDGVGDHLSLEQLGASLYIKMQDVAKTDRPAWYRELAKPQQVALLVYLRRQDFSSMTISNDLDVPVRTVSMYFNQYAENVGANVLAARSETVAGLLQLRVEQLIERINSLSEEEYNALDKAKLVWTITKDHTKLLTDLGFIDRAPTKVEVTTRQAPPDTQEELLNRLEELNKKKQQRMIELRKDTDEQD